MRSKRILDGAIDYNDFSEPYRGLAAMIFVQAAADLDLLNGRDNMSKDSVVVSREEIRRFLLSDWADYLAEVMRIDKRDITRYVRGIECG